MGADLRQGWMQQGRGKNRQKGQQGYLRQQGGVKVKRTKDKQKGIARREWRGTGREEEEVD
jgi:hypothetical protein